MWRRQERELLDTGQPDSESFKDVKGRQSLVTMRGRGVRNRAPATWRTTLDDDSALRYEGEPRPEIHSFDADIKEDILDWDFRRFIRKHGAMPVRVGGAAHSPLLTVSHVAHALTALQQYVLAYASAYAPSSHALAASLAYK